MKILFINLIAVFAIFTFSGCSSKDSSSYYILHNLAKQECNKIINPDERQQCINEHSQSYDQNKYQKTNQ
jgi:hypothetical protein